MKKSGEQIQSGQPADSTRILSDRELNPILRGANYIQSNRLRMGPRFNYGNQLCYVVEGTGVAKIGEKVHTIADRTLYLYGPGTEHHIETDSVSTSAFTCYFSLTDIPDYKLATANSYVTELDDAFWRKADEPLDIPGLPPLPFTMQLTDSQHAAVIPLMRDMVTQFRTNREAGALYTKGLLLNLIHCFRQFHQERHHPQHLSLIHQFKQTIEDNYARSLSRQEVSQALGISESYLTTLLRRELGTNFTDYLLTVRLQHSMDLIRFTGLSIKQIANRCGFNDTSYFILRFRRHYGSSPAKVRR